MAATFTPTTPNDYRRRDSYPATPVGDLAVGDVVRRTNENWVSAPVGVVVAVHGGVDGVVDGEPWATVLMGDDQWSGSGEAWTRVPAKVTTTLTAPGERAVKVDGHYVGLVVKDTEGWRYAGASIRTFRTFTEAAQFAARRAGRLAGGR